MFTSHLLLDIPVMRGSAVYNWRLKPILTRGKDGTITRNQISYQSLGAVSRRCRRLISNTPAAAMRPQVQVEAANRHAQTSLYTPNLRSQKRKASRKPPAL